MDNLAGDSNALITDVNVRASDQLRDLSFFLPAE
jgi:hypothetical protein